MLQTVAGALGWAACGSARPAPASDDALDEALHPVGRI